MDINVELLVGTKVRDANGESVGRIEEFLVERDGNSYRVVSYLIGASALVDRLAAWTLVRPVVRALHARKLYSVYDVPWQEMDLSDPARPKLRISVNDLRHVK